MYLVTRESFRLLTLEANSEYSKVKVKTEDWQKADFTSHHGLYRFVGIPFGLQNASSTFLRTMKAALSAVKWKLALVYLEDTVVFSRSSAKQIEHVRYVLTLQSEVGVVPNSRKCNFFTERTDYFRHVILLRRLETVSHKIDANKILKAPRNVTKLKAFLGLCNDFCRLLQCC